MKPHYAFYIIAALVVALSAISHSQANAPTIVKTEIPFEFTVGDSVFQPGPYEVTLTWQGLVWVRGAHPGVKIVNSQTARSATPMEHTKLVFHCVDGRCFLAQIWLDGRSAGRELPPTRLERELLSKAKPQMVDVLARK
jgi:hypothetical protein